MNKKRETVKPNTVSPDVKAQQFGFGGAYMPRTEEQEQNKAKKKGETEETIQEITEEPVSRQKTTPYQFGFGGAHMPSPEELRRKGTREAYELGVKLGYWK